MQRHSTVHMKVEVEQLALWVIDSRGESRLLYVASTKPIFKDTANNSTA